MLERVGLERLADRYPQSLSSGERQRVAVAQALVKNPRLLLADEPTGTLDTDNGDQVLDLMLELCAEQRVGGILVTHDPRAAERGHRVLTLKDGQLMPGDAADSSDGPSWRGRALR
jgi:ABC-type lipoprotein export system ATPase subunit